MLLAMAYLDTFPELANLFIVQNALLPMVVFPI